MPMFFANASFLSIAAGSLVVFGIYYTLWIIYARTLHPLAKYPGPFLASVSRSWMAWRLWKADAEVVQLQLHDKHGTFVRIAPDEISISDPAAIRQMYGASSNYTKTDFYVAFRGHFGRFPDLFTELDEKRHAERRRIVNHLYSMSSVVRSEACIDNCLELLVDKLSRDAASYKTVDMVQWVQWFAFDVIGELFFSRAFGFLEKEDDHGRWIASFNKLLPVLALTSVLPTYIRMPILMASMAIPGAGGALQRLQKIEAASETCVTERLELIQQKREVRNDILQQMLQIHQEKGDQLDFQMIDIQMEVYVGLVAGSDTTMTGIISTLYHLLKTPVALNKLQLEIDAADRSGALSATIQYQEAVKLPYLGACIKEGLRMHPSAALSFARHVPPGGATLCGEHFPAGYRVGINPAVIHCNERCFGPDARTFVPERWLRSGADAIERYFFTFGSGARTCIGKNISLCETYKLIPQLIRDFDFELVHGPDWEWTTLNHWFNKPQSLPVRIRARRSK